jgi:hypothetical protein
MRDTRQELEQSMEVLKTLQDTRILQNGVLAVLIFCIPSLTLSTILWQWLG